MTSGNPVRFLRSHLPRGLASLGLALLLACQGGSIEETRALQDAGAFEESIEPLRNILSTQPDHAEASYRLGLALLRTGRTSQSLWPLRKASETEEWGRPAGLILASTLFGMENYEEAVVAADRVVQLDPENEAALLTRARAYMQAKQLVEALGDSDRLLAINPENLDALSIRAAVLGELGRWDEAHPAFDAVYAKAKEQDSPHVGRTCIVRAKAFAAEGKLEKSIEEIDVCLESHRDGATVSQAVQAFDELEMADRSLELLREVQAESPDDLRLLVGLANKLNVAGKGDEAEALFVEFAERSGNPDAWQHLASIRYRNRNLEGARAAIEEALAGTPNPPESLRFRYAEVLVDMGDLDGAEGQLPELKEELYINLLKGRLTLERGDPRGALNYLEPAIVQWPNHEASRMYAARAASELGDLDMTMKQLREATRIAPKDSEAAILLARLYYSQGDYASAAAMSRRHQRYRGFTGPEAFLIHSRSLAALGRYDQAEEVLKALNNQPGMRPIAAAEMGSLATQRANGDPAAGVAAMGRFEIDPADPENGAYLRQLIDLQVQAGQAEQARTLTSRLASQHPDTALFHALQGHVLLEQQDPGAEAALDRALELNADEAIALAGKAKIARARGDHVAAADLLDRAALAEPAQPSYAYAAAQEMLAAGQLDEAERRLTYLVHANPELAGAANDLAWLLAERGDRLDFALLLAQRSERMARGPEVLDTLGWVYYRRDELEQAEGAFRNALELNPDYATARYHLGLVLAKRGDRAAALDALRTAVASGAFPEEKAARTEIARLESE